MTTVDPIQQFTEAAGQLVGPGQTWLFQPHDPNMDRITVLILSLGTEPGRQGRIASGKALALIKATAGPGQGHLTEWLLRPWDFQSTEARTVSLLTGPNRELALHRFEVQARLQVADYETLRRKWLEHEVFVTRLQNS